MKKMFCFVIILVVSLALVGCMDDKNKGFVNSDNSNEQIDEVEEVPEVVNNELYGIWTSSKNENVDITFHEDGTGLYSENNTHIDFTYTGGENKLDVLFADMKSKVSCTYNIENNNLEFVCGDVVFYSEFSR